jgi:hypothetical protein
VAQRGGRLYCILFVLISLLASVTRRVHSLGISLKLSFLSAPPAHIRAPKRYPPPPPHTHAHPSGTRAHTAATTTHSLCPNSWPTNDARNQARDGHVGVLCVVLLLYGVALAAWGAPMCAWMVESFPISARYTAVAIGYVTLQPTSINMWLFMHTSASHFLLIEGIKLLCDCLLLFYNAFK